VKREVVRRKSEGAILLEDKDNTTLLSPKEKKNGAREGPLLVIELAYGR